MLFNSYEFIFAFLPITFIVYFWLNAVANYNSAKLFLVCSSLFFYSWRNVLYLPILIGSIIFNYFVGYHLRELLANRTSLTTSKLLLSIGIAFNLGLLGYFKYADFFIENTNNFVGTTFAPLNLALPLAISFFTFQQIAFLVDCYKQEAEDRGFINYVVFVSFFPQLIAGPIVHNREMIPQFSDSKNKQIIYRNCLLYTSPSPRDLSTSRMPSSA